VLGKYPIKDVIGYNRKLTTARAINAIVDINPIIDYNLGMLSHEPPMASLTIRNLDSSIKERLRVRAAQNGRSMEAELRAIIIDAVETPTRPSELNLYDRIRARFEPLGGVELELPPRGPMREPPSFE